MTAPHQLEAELTPRQIASRANGAKSKGPKTEEGKARSSQNARKHGLCDSTAVVLPTESLEEFEDFKQELFQQYEPTDLTEELLVQQIANYAWRLQRLIKIESELLTPTIFPGVGSNFFQNGAAGPKVLLITRYETNLERRMHANIKLLEQLKKAKRTQAQQEQREKEKTKRTQEPPNPTPELTNPPAQQGSPTQPVPQQNYQPKPPIGAAHVAMERYYDQLRRELQRNPG